MMTRRNFVKTLGGAAALAAGSQLEAAGRLAWPGPIGIQIYTVRDAFAKDHVGTLKLIATTGYKEIEIGTDFPIAELMPDVKADGLTIPSAYLEAPKTVDDWKKTVDGVSNFGLHYIVVGDNPKMDSDAWMRRAELFNQCGTYALSAKMQFCYHAHFHEFESNGGDSGYDIMAKHCDPKLLKFEMDVFWATYSGVDPVHYFTLYPGRFPLLHIKDLYKDVPVDPHESPPRDGPNPFAPVGQGKIDWPRIFAHTKQAGTRHIYVEQDRWNQPSVECMKISYDYLKNLRLS
jgi:sugar phosphate isomerase/epimerase